MLPRLFGVQIAHRELYTCRSLSQRMLDSNKLNILVTQDFALATLYLLCDASRWHRMPTLCNILPNSLGYIGKILIFVPNMQYIAL